MTGSNERAGSLGSVQNGLVLLADLVDALGRADRADRRADKVSVLAELLRSTPIEDVESVVALVVGTLRPAHDISGWTSTLSDAVAPASTSSLTVDEVRRATEEMSIASGPQAVEAAGHGILDLLGRATESEQVVIRSTLDPDGEPPISASVMSSAIANAARVRVGDVRRAASVTGSLATTATLAFLEGTTALESVEPRRRSADPADAVGSGR